MTDNIISGIVTVMTAIIGVAILAVIVSKNSNTSGVISSAGSAFAGALSAATAPITGSTSFSGGSTLNQFASENPFNNF